MKHLIALKTTLLSFLLMPVIATAAPAEYTIRWVMAHRPETYFVATGERFKKNVEAATGGKVRVKIVTDKLSAADNVRIPYLRAEALQKIEAKEYEMSQIYLTVLAPFVPRLSVLELPFLFQSDAEVTNVLEGDIGNELLADLDRSPVKALAFTYSGGFLVVPSSGKEIRSTADFKDIKYAPWPGKYGNQVTETLGAKPVAYGFSNDKVGSKVKFLNNLLDDGSAEAGELSCADVGEYLQTSKKMKTVNLTRHRVVLTALVMNKDFYAELPAPLREQVLSAAKDAARFERELIVADCTKIVNRLRKESKIKVIDFNNPGEMIAKLEPVYRDVLSAKENQLLYKRITKSTGRLP